MSRSLGTIQLDDNVNTFIVRPGIIVPSTRNLDTAGMANRHGRVVMIRDDDKPLTVEIHGQWADGGGKYWEDFKAALMAQARTRLTRGDGTQFQMVDVLDIAHTPIAQSGEGSATPQRLYGYVAKVQSYEPFARETSPAMQSLGSLNNGNGTFTTTFTVNYSGTAYAEPTWQMALAIPSGVTVSAAGVQNTTTGENASVSGLSLTNGTFYVLFDAVWGPRNSPATTPDNNSYGLLATNSLGYGCTVYQSGGSATDTDFTGRVPTLVESSAPQLPPVANPNTIVASVTATAALTSATLSVLAPKRYMR